MIDYSQGKRKVFEKFCFVRNGNCYLAKISVYEGGRIECWGTMNREQFLEKANSGWITVDLPDGAELRIGDQEFVVKQAETLNQDGSLMFKHKWITQADFIKDVLDAEHTAKGNKSAAQLCCEAYDHYLQYPTPENKEKLRVAYEDVPKHNRRFVLGDQDLKDFPILDILNEP
jgi:hypothetical protein